MTVWTRFLSLLPLTPSVTSPGEAECCWLCKFKPISSCHLSWNLPFDIQLLHPTWRQKFYLYKAQKLFPWKKARNIFGVFLWETFFWCSHNLYGQCQNFVQCSLPQNSEFLSKISRLCLWTPKYRQSSLLPCLVSIVTILSLKSSHSPAFNNSLVRIHFKKFTKRRDSNFQGLFILFLSDMRNS